MITLDTGTMGGEIKTETSFRPEHSQRMVLSDARCVVGHVGETDDGTWPMTGFRDPSEIYFFVELERYLALEGVSQKSFRSEMASHITQSRYPLKRIRQVLTRIGQNPSEDRLQAAIDLLSMTGQHVETVAKAFAFSVEATNEDAAFVLAAAAGRANRKLICEVLKLAGSEAMREAAAELAVDLPKREGRSLLRAFARHDKAPYVRELAARLLQEID